MYNISHQGILNWKPTKDATKSKRKKTPPEVACYYTTPWRCWPIRSGPLRNLRSATFQKLILLGTSRHVHPKVVMGIQWRMRNLGFPDAEFFRTQFCLFDKQKLQNLDHEKTVKRSTKTMGSQSQVAYTICVHMNTWTPQYLDKCLSTKIDWLGKVWLVQQNDT